MVTLDKGRGSCPAHAPHGENRSTLTVWFNPLWLAKKRIPGLPSASWFTCVCEIFFRL